jgi:protein required for attachment to host cells
MVDLCIVVADGSRARLFTATRGEDAEATKLQELEDLVEPERGMADREIYSDKSGQNRPGSGFEDHRKGHREEVERRFAKRIVAAVAQLLHQQSPGSLVVVADPRLLGLLRGPLDASLPRDVPRTEIAADLTWQPLHALRKTLEKMGVLPAQAGVA